LHRAAVELEDPGLPLPYNHLCDPNQVTLLVSNHFRHFTADYLKFENFNLILSCRWMLTLGISKPVLKERYLENKINFQNFEILTLPTSGILN